MLAQRPARSFLPAAMLLALLFAPLVPQPAAAQSTVNYEVKNFGQASFDTVHVGTDNDNNNGPGTNSGAGAVASTHNSEIAQGFTTGGSAAHRFQLSAVWFQRRGSFNDPGDLFVTLHEKSGSNPGRKIADLEHKDSNGNRVIRPRDGTDLRYTPGPGNTITLNGATEYFVKLRVVNYDDESNASDKVYDFWSTSANNEDSGASPGWSIADTLRWKPTRTAAWRDSNRNQSIKLRVEATASEVQVKNFDAVTSGSFKYGIGNTGATDFPVMGFTTGGSANSRFAFTDITLQLNSTSGDPNNVSVTINEAAGGFPGASLGTLIGPAKPRQTASPTNITYRAPAGGIVLHGATTYFMYMQIAIPPGGSYHLDAAESDAEDSGSSTGWSLANNSLGRSNNSSWFTGGVFSLKMQVRAQPLPDFVPPPPGSVITISDARDKTQTVYDGVTLIVTNTGSISAPNGGQAMLATTTGAIMQNSGAITGNTSANDTNAIQFIGNNNTLTNENNGTITTTYNGNRGAQFVGDGNTITNRGTVTTNGEWAHGLNQSGNNNRIVNESGATVETKATQNGGRYPPAIVQEGGMGNVAINHGTIKVASGHYAAVGIRQSGGGNRAYNYGTINANGRGISSIDDGNYALNAGTITSNNIGMESFGDNNTISMTGGSINANIGVLVGDDGGDSSGDNQLITISGGTITATGNDADGIRIDGDDSRIAITAATVTISGARYGIYTDSDADNNTITVAGTVQGGSNSIKVDGTGNTIILEAGANIIGALAIANGNTLIDNRPGSAPPPLPTPDAGEYQVSSLDLNGSSNSDTFIVGYGSALMSRGTVTFAAGPSVHTTKIRTGANGPFDLKHIQLPVSRIVGVPRGLEVSVWNDPPTTRLFTLTAPEAIAAPGTYNWRVAAGAPALASNTDYNVMLRAVGAEHFTAVTGYHVLFADVTRRNESSQNPEYPGWDLGPESGVGIGYTGSWWRNAGNDPSQTRDFATLNQHNMRLIFAGPPVLPAVAGQNYSAGAAIPPLTLPAARGGAAPYTYSLSPALPAGLALNARVISGTPSAASAATYTWQATDNAGATASAAFGITVNTPVPPPPPGLAAVTDQTYVAGSAIAPLTLPAATGGTAPYTYMLAPQLPAGLSFNSTVMPPTITGAPATAAAGASYTYSVRDSTGLSAARVFAITIAAAAPPLVLPAVPAQNFTAGQTVASTLPAATGGSAPYTYSITPAPENLPAGLTFNGAVSPPTITGTPQNAAATLLIVLQAADAVGATVSQTFALTVMAAAPVNNPPVAVGGIPAQMLTLGDAAVTLGLTGLFSDADAGDTLTYSATSSAPLVAAVTVNGANVIVRALAAGSAIITITADDGNGGSAMQTVAVQVAAASVAPPPPQPVNNPPLAVGSLPAQMLTLGDAPVTLSLTGLFSDADAGDVLTYSAISSAPLVAAVTVSNGSVIVRVLGAGNAVVTVMATDAGGASASVSFAVNVAGAMLDPLAALRLRAAQAEAALDAARARLAALQRERAAAQTRLGTANANLASVRMQLAAVNADLVAARAAGTPERVAAAVAAQVQMRLIESIDINRDGVIDADDFLIMYYAEAHAAELGDGNAGGTAAARARMLAGLRGALPATDATYQLLLRRANALGLQ